MALTMNPQNSPTFTPDSLFTRVLAFVAGGLAGFTLMGVLSLHVWPSVLPYSRFLVTEGAGLAAAVFVAVACGLAGLIACAARCDSDADRD
ncbi:MAG TPA: hypothetical protein VNA14_05590 [Mycobacteriales bacterium]|nr:hypothetical protein [Mycobacteriales bacterium]